MTLHDRLLAEVERRKALAVAAMPGPWAVWRDLDAQGFYAVGEASGVIPEGENWVDGEHNPTAHVYVIEDAEFIAGHDPADALRRYEHYERVLERHSIIWRTIGWMEGGDTEYAELPVCVRCVPKHSHFRTRAEVPQACDDILDLAAALDVEVSDG